MMDKGVCLTSSIGEGFEANKSGAEAGLGDGVGTGSREVRLRPRLETDDGVEG